MSAWTVEHFGAKANYPRSVRNTRSGVIGRRLSRMPVALATAFEIAGAMPTIGGSPMPLAPNGPSSSGSSTRMVSISGGTSMMPGIL